MKKITIIGVLFASALGTLFHFLYHYIPIFLFPKNESIFEHTKLVVFPIYIYTISAMLFLKEERKGFFCQMMSVTLFAVLFIIVGYYTYSGFIGKNIDWINIVLYYASLILSFFIGYKKMILFSFHNSIIFSIILFILMVIFTYYPPMLSFFSV